MPQLQVTRARTRGLRMNSRKSSDLRAFAKPNICKELSAVGDGNAVTPGEGGSEPLGGEPIQDSTRITKDSGTTPSWAIASAAALLCMAAIKASISGTSIISATRFGFCGSTNVRMLVTPSGPNSSLRFGDVS